MVEPQATFCYDVFVFCFIEYPGFLHKDKVDKFLFLSRSIHKEALAQTHLPAAYPTYQAVQVPTYQPTDMP